VRCRLFSFKWVIFIFYIYIYNWLVVDLPLWKIWKSVVIIIPDIYIYMEKYKLFQTTNQIRCPMIRKPKSKCWLMLVDVGWQGARIIGE
jgi:hypothetical protein